MPENGKDRTRFAEYVKLQAGDRGFLSRDEEKMLLQDGIARFNVDYDEARWILTGVAAEEQVASSTQGNDAQQKMVSSNRQAIVFLYREPLTGKLVYRKPQRLSNGRFLRSWWGQCELSVVVGPRN